MFINVAGTLTYFDGHAIIVRGHQRLQFHYASKVVKYFIDTDTYIRQNGGLQHQPLQHVRVPTTLINI
jgi:hypothetical protein